MMTPETSRRITQGYTEAAAGYATAATAAYTGLASQILDFWCTALSGLVEPDTSTTDTTADRDRSRTQVATVAPRSQEPAFGFSPADWCPFPMLDPRRFDTMWRLTPATPPAVAMLALANAVPLRGPSSSWGFARMMIDLGIPRTVAWPAAEAGAAALDAADAASVGMTRILASFQSENGFAMSAQAGPPVTPTLLALAGLAVLSMPFASMAPPWIA